MTTTAARTRGPYAKTAKLRGRAVDAGIEVFGRAGYHGATLTEIASMLGMSLTGLQHHFPDKESLLAEVLAERDFLAAQNLSTKSDLDALEGLLNLVVENQRTPGLMQLYCVLSAEATSPSHPAHTFFRERYRQLRDELAALFQRMAERSVVPVTFDPSGLASAVIALTDGLQLQWLLEPGSVDVEDQLRRFLAPTFPCFAPTRDLTPEAG